MGTHIGSVIKDFTVDKCLKSQTFVCLQMVDSFYPNLWLIDVLFLKWGFKNICQIFSTHWPHTSSQTFVKHMDSRFVNCLS